MSMVHHSAAMPFEHVPIEALGHPGGGIGEHRCLVIVAIGMQAVHTEIIPGRGIYLILLSIKGSEVHQCHHRLSGHIPASQPQAKPLGFCGRTPGREEGGIFRKERVGLSCPHVRADEHQVVAHHLMQRLGMSGEDGVDAAHLVAHLPAALKNEFGD